MVKTTIFIACVLVVAAASRGPLAGHSDVTAPTALTTPTSNDNYAESGDYDYDDSFHANFAVGEEEDSEDGRKLLVPAVRVARRAGRRAGRRAAYYYH